MDARAGEFWIETTSAAGEARVMPHGEIDLATAPQLRAALEALGDDHTTVIIDLSDVSFIDSSGLSVLFLFGRAARRTGLDLTITGARDEVASSLELTGLDTVLHIEPAD